MRWIITLLLITLVAAGAGYLVFEQEVQQRLNPTANSASTSLELLERRLTPDAITRIELTATDTSLSLTRDGQGAWTQPGNWPVRPQQVQELVQTLASLKTRFLPILLDPNQPNLAAYGLAPEQKPRTVVVTSQGQPITLTLGRVDGETTAFLRVNKENEVLRVGQDVFEILGRPASTYRRKQLWTDAERVHLPDDPPAKLTAITGPALQRISVKTPTSEYQLQRLLRENPPARRTSLGGESAVLLNELAMTWELASPVRDHVEPSKLRGILTTIPELWVDRFTEKKADAMGMKETGLDRPQYTIRVETSSGTITTLLIGNIARTIERDGPPGPPMGPIPPMPTKIKEDFHYGMLEGNSLIFEISGARLKDLAVPIAELRDPRVARFEPNEVTQVTVTQSGQPDLVLQKRKGNRAALSPQDRQDRWYLGSEASIPAESSIVTELLEAIAKWEGSTQPAANQGSATIVDQPTPERLKELGLTDPSVKLTIVAQQPVADGEPAAPTRTYTLHVGKETAESKMLPVLLFGSTRVNLVPNDAGKLLTRPALAYRSKRPLDTTDLVLTRLQVLGTKKPFTLEKITENWQLKQPLTCPIDDTKVSPLVSDLSQFEVVTFADDQPKEADLAGKYGLSKPSLTVMLDFTGPKPRQDRLVLGAAVPGKDEVYARLNDSGSVLTVKSDLVNRLNRGAEDLLPRTLWQMDPETVEEFELTTPKSTLKLVKQEGKYIVASAENAPADRTAIQDYLSSLMNFSVERFSSLDSPDLKTTGLETPVATLRIKGKSRATGEAPSAPLERTIQIGSTNPESPGQVYARIPNDPHSPNAIVLVNEAALPKQTAQAIDFMTADLLTLDPATIEAITISTGTAETSAKILRKDKDQWAFDQSEAPLDRARWNKMIEGVARLPVIRLADYGSKIDWAKYGLDKPTFSLSVTVKTDSVREITIDFGKEEPSGERYVRVGKESKAVGVISGAGVSGLVRDRQELLDRSVFSFDPVKVQSLKRTSKTEVLEISPAALGWNVVQPSMFKADAPFVEELLQQLSQLSFKKAVAFAPKDFAAYGLDQPTTWTITTDRAPPLSLLLGKPVAESTPNSDRYAAIANQGKVMVGILDEGIVLKLLGIPANFQDRTLVNLRSDPDVLLMETGDRKLKFVRKASQWKLSEPVVAEAESAELDTLVAELSRLRADQFVADKPKDLKPFGLDVPQRTITLLEADKPVLKLSLGIVTPDTKKIHARIDQAEQVVLLDSALTRRLLGEFRQRAVWQGVDASQVGSLTISQGTGTIVFKKTGTAWTDESMPADPVDSERINETLSTLANLKAERYVADSNGDVKLYGLEKPSSVIVVSVPMSPAKVLQLGGAVGGTNGKQVYARVQEAGRTEIFVLSEADTGRLVRSRADYLKKK